MLPALVSISALEEGLVKVTALSESQNLFTF